MRYVPHFDGRGTRGEVLVLRVAVGRHGILNDAVLDGFDLSDFKRDTGPIKEIYRTNQNARYKDPVKRNIPDHSKINEIPDKSEIKEIPDQSKIKERCRTR